MSCIACGSTRLSFPPAPDLERLEPRGRFGSSRVDAPVPALARCTACGLAFRHPLPSAEEVRAIYQQLEDECYLAEQRNRRRGAQRALSLVERHATPADGALLDVGCSAGIFLDEARKRGWVIRGIEPSTSLSGRARALLGDCIETATFETARADGGPFAAITFWDVLEHAVDPLALLSKARDLAMPRGVVVLNVPRRDSPVARVLGSRWPLLLPEHLYYFTPKSVRRLAERAGLETVRFHAHPVFFSFGYVVHRLSQHRFAGARRLATRLEGTRLARVSVPLVMGEMTVVCRAK